MNKLADDFDKYMIERTEEEKEICQTIERILNSGYGWCAPGGVLFENGEKYLLNIEGELEIGIYDMKCQMFFIAGENAFREIKEVESVYL